MYSLSLFINRLILLHASASVAFTQTNAQPKPSVWDAGKWTYIHEDAPDAAPIRGVTHHILHSAKMDRDVGFNILLPDDYASSGKRYPVVYALHGASGHEGSRWISPLVGEMMRQGKARPAIWVWPAGGQGSMWRDGPEGNPHHVYVETFVIKELIPHIDKTWRTIAAREGRAVMGFSMGGYGSAFFAFKHPELFCATVPCAGGAFVMKPEDEGKPNANDYAPAWHLRKNLAAIKGRQSIFIVASEADMNYQPTRKLTAVLDELAVPYERACPPGIAHDLNQYVREVGRPLVLWLHGHLASVR